VAPVSTDAADPTFSVGELAAAIRLVLETTLPDEIWVRGEIADLNRARNGHVYFSLVEPGELGRGPAARISVVLLADRRHVVNQILTRAGGAVRMTDGVEIRLRGRVDFYAPGGRLSLLMTLIDPAYTLGRLGLERDRLLRALAQEGLLRRQAALELSPAPLRIALVTSHGSAAEQDALTELQRSGFGFDVRTFHAQVQGAGSPETVVRALETAHREGYELVLLVRGGGARTDLVAFDSELVARAVAACPVPVWTGIGHETDRSVADEVAHSAFKTPTACAAALVERVATFLRTVESRWAAIAGLAAARLDAAEADLQRRRVRVERDALTALRLADRSLDTRRAALQREARRSAERAGDRLRIAEARIEAADPQRALARGFSLTRRAGDGQLVRSPADAGPGVELVTVTAGGDVHSTVVTDA
jgi:exodeoxyribonuclease VII large subunit